MNAPLSQYTLMTTTRYALCVMLICYLPHFATAPIWLFTIVLIAVGYRLIADYYGYPLLGKLVRIFLVIMCLFFLKLNYGSILSSGYFIGFLLTFIGLKTIEIHNLRDLKVIVICNFYLIFSALIVIQELWIIVYLLIAILANCSLMLKLSAPQATLRQIGGKSTKQLLIAIPLSIILFYIFPRIADPLWQVPANSQNHIGFSEKMNPGSIAELFSNDNIALRVTFKNKPILNGYWRGLILGFYNGVSWGSTRYNPESFTPLPELGTDAQADYEVILEPHEKKWLFYTGYPLESRPNLLFLASNGLISENKEFITQRFAYALTIQSMPYKELNSREKLQNTQLPNSLNPKLKKWAKEQFNAVHQDPKAFIDFLHHYINEQPFWYTLSPPDISTDKNQMDAFWFDTQKGFCEHYASAVTIILRSTGIPSRVIVGYRGGEWNPLAQYLTIHQNDAHAWVEYWQESKGWQQIDPTSFVNPERIDQKIKDMQDHRYNEINYDDSSVLSWLQRSKLLFASARFFAERWLLFYNQATQRDLLQKLGLGQWSLTQLLQFAIVCLVGFIILIGFCYHWLLKRSQDPLLVEYHLLQKEFRRFNVPTHMAATLKQQCTALTTKAPTLSPTLAVFLSRYEQLRLHQVTENSKENKKAAVVLFKNLRKTLSQKKPIRLSEHRSTQNFKS